jgi:hypothetical protein
MRSAAGRGNDRGEERMLGGGAGEQHLVTPCGEGVDERCPPFRRPALGGGSTTRMHNDVGSCNAMAFEDIPDSSCGDWIGWPYQWIGLRCQQARLVGVSQYCQQCSHQFEISRRDMLALERDWVSQKRADSRMIRSDPYRNTGQCAEPGSPPVIIAQDDQGHGTTSSETAGESKE